MRTYKYRIYPTKAQETILKSMLEECRWLYNKILETRKNSYEQDGKSLRLYDTQNMIPTWKDERPSLKSVHSLVLQQVNIRVDLAFKAFFRRVKAGETPGYPRFKGYGRYDSMTFTQYGNGVKIVDGKLSISKLGSIKLVLHRDLIGIPKTVCISRSATGKWFACVSCVTEEDMLPDNYESIGIDLGLSTFATFSDGDKIENPRFFKKEQDALAKAQRLLNKEAIGTPERTKRRKVVSRIYERITNKRTNFAHQESRKLVNRYGVIIAEKLSVVDMMSNHTQVFGNKLNKSIADVAWSQFVQFTTYKAEDAGRLFLQVDPRNTSKMCSCCGSIVTKDLSIRTHSCYTCGLVTDRDHNAALNILALGLQRISAGLPDVAVEAPSFSYGE